MSSKINPSMIIKQHIDTLYDNRDDKISKWDILFFFIFPLILAVGLIYFNKELKSSADSLLVSLSIFTPLLLSLLVLIYDMGQKAVDKEQKSQFYGNYDSYMVKLREITANISFSILISIIVIVFLVVYSLNLGDNWYWKSF